MTLSQDPSIEPIDYWRAVTRRGVLALGFRVQRSAGTPTLVAELTGPLDGWTRRAALAAISVHEAVQRTNDLPLIAAHAVLIMALERTPAVAALAAYQDLLSEALWKAVEVDPARRIETLSQGAPS